ncbi:MAG: NAD-dependent epimerase [Lentisphaerae bacterium]|nr:MAG: NAD-dependent epimerase [Lentisphaerota bacterium]
MNTYKQIAITGVAGFIGFHLAQRLLEQGWDVFGIDNVNDYYDPALKEKRLEILAGFERFRFTRGDITDARTVDEWYASAGHSVMVNLAAQAGVRYSLEHPRPYIDTNIVGFLNILETCRHHHCPHLLYASSSSVYGGNKVLPFSVEHSVDHPVSLYAATKKSNELMAHTYSHLFGLPTTGLRFFTVYGPWGRPDMAIFKFTRWILNDEELPVYNYGKMQRDFTYVDDIVEGIIRLIPRAPQATPDYDMSNPSPGRSTAPYRIYNIGNNQPVELMHLIGCLEKLLGKKAKLNLMPIQPGDVPATFADISDLEREIGFRPGTSIEDGLARFVAWYREYYHV